MYLVYFFPPHSIITGNCHGKREFLYVLAFLLWFSLFAGIVRFENACFGSRGEMLRSCLRILSIINEFLRFAMKDGERWIACVSGTSGHENPPCALALAPFPGDLQCILYARPCALILAPLLVTAHDHPISITTVSSMIANSLLACQLLPHLQ